MDQCTFRTDREGTDATVWVGGEVDMTEAASFERILVELAEEGMHTVIVDLSNVTFMGSAGLSAIVTGHRQIAERGGELSLRGPSKIVRRILEATALDQVIRVTD